MELAKDRLDVGLFTDDPAMVDFMANDVGLGQPELLQVRRGMTQHRFDVAGSVVKVNVVERLDTDRRSGYREVMIADETADAGRKLVGPDGVKVVVAPPGFDGVEQLGVVLAVPDLAVAVTYFRDVLGWDTNDEGARLGASIIRFVEDGDAPSTVEMPVRGWTYLTVQIHDCDAETDAACTKGAALAREAVTMGQTARFSMIADPFGNQLELSQRASLTGPLP